MNKTIKKIGLILIIIIILPAAFLTISELTSLSENERVIEEIYSDQLEAILYSVNQYSEDVVSNWANQIDILLDELEKVDGAKSKMMIDSFFNEFTSLNMILVADSIGDKEAEFVLAPAFMQSLDSAIIADSLNNKINKILADNDSLIRRLYTYKRGGYRKIEPVTSDFLQDNSLMFFVDEAEEKKDIRGVVINPQMFIYRILSPKIQKIAEEEFIISVFNLQKNFQFNSTKDFETKEVQQERELWIFPDYKIGISLVGKTIKDLVEQRAITNIILISMLTLILIFGVWVVFRNVKREVELAQIKSDFVSNVSHELRTPLSLISMFAETLELERVKSEEKKKEYYTIISQEANRLGRIVNTILGFSKIEAGKRKFHFVEKDLNELVEQIYTNYSFHLKNKGFSFAFEIKETLPKVKLDEEATSEAIINLIDNAVKYSDEIKEINIRTGLENGFAFVEVSDKGIGIPEEDQKKIFEKFFRVSTGLIHNTKGTGLGLTLVKHIMDAHGGSIELNSRFGGGSSFKLLFLIIS